MMGHVCTECHGAGYHVCCPYCEMALGAGGIGGNTEFALAILNYYESFGEDDGWPGIDDVLSYVKLADRCEKGYDCGCVKD